MGQRALWTPNLSTNHVRSTAHTICLMRVPFSVHQNGRKLGVFSRMLEGNHSVIVLLLLCIAANEAKRLKLVDFVYIFTRHQNYDLEIMR